MQVCDDVWLDSTKLAQQELSEQCVIAVPLSPTVERYQEHVQRFKVAKLLMCV